MMKSAVNLCESAEKENNYKEVKLIYLQTVLNLYL